MGKNISIQEGGTAKQMTLEKLKTNLVGGGTCLWVPENETQLTTKSITKNGAYTAEKDNVYGWSSVYVNVPSAGAVTGTGSDGKQHTISTDQSGNIVDNITPVEIRITAGPNYTGPYGVGAYIGFDGLVVHAYDSSGADMGAVPFEELVFPVTVAPANTGYDVYDYGDYVDSGEVTIQGVGSIISALKYAETMNSFTDEGVLSEIINELIVYEGVNPGYVSVYVKDSEYRGWSPITVTVWGSLSQGDSVTLGPYPCEGIRIQTYGIRNEGETELKITDYMITTFTRDTLWEGERYWSDGNYYEVSTINAVLVSNAVQIPVQWQRPGDGLVLETSFGISVVPLGGGTND